SPCPAACQVVSLSLHDALPISIGNGRQRMVLLHRPGPTRGTVWVHLPELGILFTSDSVVVDEQPPLAQADSQQWLDSLAIVENQDRKSTRLNSSHVKISYAVFC